MADQPASTGERLAALASRAREAGHLALDTEFMSEGRYWPRLCLLALAVETPGEPGGAVTELLDPFDDPDPDGLPALLSDPGIEIVVHAGRQDLGILRREWDVEPRNVFDTQVAAGFAGYPAQAAYGRLVEAALGVKLAKGEGFTRWDVRPLTDTQVTYAHQDVAHLPALAHHLRERLAARGRLDWVHEECRPLEHAAVGRDPDEAFRRLPKVSQLKPAQIAVARELAGWRERTAAEEDRTVNAVLGDPQLIELARRRPTDEPGLEQIRGLYPKTIKRRGREILAAIAAGRDAPPVELGERSPPPDPGESARIGLAEALVRTRAQEAGLAYELVASRAELTAIARAVKDGAPPPELRTLTGWRRELVAEDLLALLEGKRALSIDGQGRLRVEATQPH